jgi:hypothetical protein
MKRKTKAAPKAAAKPMQKPAGRYKFQVGPVTPPPGSRLKPDGPKGTGRMK